MQATAYKEVNELLNVILTETQRILGQKLVGLYLFGSLVVGDFDMETSDIDLVAALAGELDEEEFRQLEGMHGEIVERNREWDNRVEVGYIEVRHLKENGQRYNMALISPGEPLHMKEAGNDWVINRYVLREKGRALYGPAAHTLVAPLTRDEITENILANARAWREWITHHEIVRPRHYQAYMRLTMCREYYRWHHHGEVVSKLAAAQWAMAARPEWEDVIQEAVAWREDWRNKQVDHDATLERTLSFARFVLDQIER